MPPVFGEGNPREPVLVRATSIAAIALVVVGCNRPASPLPTLPADALPGMTSETTSLSIDSLAADALDRDALRSLLDDAGYLGGRERTYAGPGRSFSLAVTRVLVFEDADGAAAYVAWVREHPSDLLGTAETLPPLDLPGAPFLLEHIPGGCCPKAVPIYLSAWRRGSTVLFVRASGRRADPVSMETLAGRLDRLVRDDPDA